MRKILVFIATTILLSACGPARPTAEQLAAADYGRVPKDPQQTVMETVRRMAMAFNPKFDTWSNLTKGYYIIPGYYANEDYRVYNGYVGCVHVDQMNKFGIYEGYTTFRYIIKNDKVISIQRAETDDYALKECNALYHVLGIYGRPSASQIVVADYGSVPKGPQQTVMEYMKTVLTNPEDARYAKWSNLRKYWLHDWHRGDTEGDDVIHYGYMGCVYINEKNKRGVYGGFRPTAYIIKNDKIITAMGYRESVEGVESGFEAEDLMEQLLMNLCAPLYQTNTNPGPVTPRQQANPQEQRVNPKSLPVRISW